MGVNRGKRFEDVIRKSFERVEGVSIDRLNDNTAGFKGIAGICDFIVYKKPYEYYIECKSVHGNILSIHSNDIKHKYGNITNTQWEGLLEKSKIKGIFAGIICWWIDNDVTKFIPIRLLQHVQLLGWKSIRFDDNRVGILAHPQQCIEIKGKKKRVFFEYDMDLFFHDVEKLRSYANE